MHNHFKHCPFGWGNKIHLLLFCREVRSPPDWYVPKQSDGHVPVKLALWWMWFTPSLPSFPDPFWSGVVAPDWVLTIGQIEQNCVLI